VKWFSTIQSGPSLERALRKAAREVRAHFNSDKADLGLLFISSAYRAEAVDLWPILKEELHITHLLGCTGGGVIGAGKEVEDRPAISLTVAVLPDVEIIPFHVTQERLPDADGGPKAWRELVHVVPEQQPSFLVLSDPFSIDSDALLAGLDFAFPQAVKVGGLTSGGSNPNEHLLLSDQKILSKGAVGVALCGDIFVEAVVAQGCRPVGEPLTITESDSNILLGVDGKPPLAYVQEMYEKANLRDKELMQSSLFLGLLMDPFKNDPKQGDFLVRNIIGLDQNRGIMAIGAPLRAGQTVQFHLRDAATSRDDLQLMLSNSQSAKMKTMAAGNPAAAGAMLFSCLGRGKRLYGEADHDSALFKSVVGDIPVGGFFCNGEIGPVGGKTYLHGYTSSIAVFSPRKKSE
jgi:small ligand-binding sensory domain FIST